MDNVFPIYQDLPTHMGPLLKKHGLKLSRVRVKIKRNKTLEIILDAVETHKPALPVVMLSDN